MSSGFAGEQIVVVNFVNIWYNNDGRFQHLSTDVNLQERTVSLMIPLPQKGHFFMAVDSMNPPHCGQTSIFAGKESSTSFSVYFTEYLSSTRLPSS